MRPYKFALLMYRPVFTTGEQLLIGIVFQTEGEEPFILVPDSSERLSKVWNDFEPDKYRSLVEFFVEGISAQFEDQDISDVVKFYQKSSGALVFSSIRSGTHPAPVERLSQLIDKLLLKNL